MSEADAQRLFARSDATTEAGPVAYQRLPGTGSRKRTSHIQPLPTTRRYLRERGSSTQMPSPSGRDIRPSAAARPPPNNDTGSKRAIMKAVSRNNLLLDCNSNILYLTYLPYLLSSTCALFQRESRTACCNVNQRSSTADSLRPSRS